MKKNFFTIATARRFSTAILTAAFILIGTQNIKANNGSDNKVKPTIAYVGAAKSVMTFNVKYNNPLQQKVVVELIDDLGVVIHRREYTDKIINDNIYLKNAGEKCNVEFVIITGKDKVSQKFNIEAQFKMVSETTVTRL